MSGSIIPPRFDYLELIFRFLFERVVRGNVVLLALAVGLSVFGRILALANFAITLQAIVAAIRPSLIVRVLNKVAQTLQLKLEINHDQVMLFLIVIIMLTSFASWLVEYLRCLCMTQVNRRLYADTRNFSTSRTMADDLFILEQLPLASQAVQKCLETSVFISLLVLLIAILAPTLALLLFPILALMVAINVYGDRAKLREQKELADARRGYVEVPGDDGNSTSRNEPADNEKRGAYIGVAERRRQRLALKPRADAIVGAAGISLVILYLSGAELPVEQLAGLIMLFVISIRYALNAGRELSINVSRLLELRKHIGVMRSLMSSKSPEVTDQ